MQLSGELFRQILSQLKSVKTNSEKRSVPRVGLRNRVTLLPLVRSGVAPIPPSPATVRDISVNGMGLLIEAPLEPDSLFAIRLPLQSRRDVTVIYQVKHCIRVEKDLYRIGASLVKIDDPKAAEESAQAPNPAAPALVSNAAEAAPAAVPAVGGAAAA